MQILSSSAHWQGSSEVSTEHLNTAKVPHAWRTAVRSQTGGSVPRGISFWESPPGRSTLQSQLPLRDLLLPLLAGRHECPGLSWEMVMENHFCLLRGTSPWCKLVTFTTTMCNSDHLRYFCISSVVSTVNSCCWLLSLRLQVIGETAQCSQKELNLFKLLLENLENKYMVSLGGDELSQISC